jgi:hypothetical protein
MDPSELNFYWQQISALEKGQRTGNDRGVVFHRGDYMLLEAEEGIKKTSCLDAARFLAGNYKFEEVEEIVS